MQTYTKLEEVQKKSCSLHSPPAKIFAYLESHQAQKGQHRSRQALERKGASPEHYRASERALIHLSPSFILSCSSSLSGKLNQKVCADRLQGCSLCRGKMPGRGKVSTKPLHSSQRGYICVCCHPVDRQCDHFCPDTSTHRDKWVLESADSTKSQHSQRLNFTRSDVWSFALSCFLCEEETEMQPLKQI